MYAYDNAEKINTAKYEFYKNKNSSKRILFEKNYSEEKMCQDSLNRKFKFELNKKVEKADQVLQKRKEFIDFHRKEKLEEEQKKIDKVHAKLDELKDIEVMKGMNETIKSACKNLTVNINLGAGK